MEHRILVFERRHHGTLHWRSVGAGFREPIDVRGSTRAKVEKSFTDAVRARLAKLSPAARSIVPPTPATYLVDIRLELTLRGEDGKRAVHRTFPFVLSSRSLHAARAAQTFFHPFRPEDCVLVPPTTERTDVLRRALSVLWADVDDEELDRLAATGKERLHTVVLDVPVRSLRDAWSEATLGARPPARITARPMRPPLVELRKVGVDLTHAAASAELSPHRARPALDRATTAMFLPVRPEAAPDGAPWQVPPTTRSCAFVGLPGSGRTTAIERAARLLLEHDGYAVSRNLDSVSRVVRLSASTVLAGMSRFGEWEKRLLTVIDECRAYRAVLAFDDLSLLGSVGRSKESDRAFADVLEGYVARGEIAVWGEATPGGLQRLADEAPRLCALIAPIPVAPADEAEASALLFFRARRIERESGAALTPSGKPLRVEIDPLALPAVVRQARALFTGVVEPQRSMQVLARLSARLSAERDAAARRTDEAPQVRHDPARLVLETLSERTGVPLELLDGSALDPESVAARFSREVVGQPEACRAVVDLMLRIKTQLTDPKRPRAVLLFTGPTGTGKTETAKWIAKNLYGGAGRLVRFDMAEYATPGSAARLLGDEHGGLAARAREQPFSVVLLDEIEKAHPSVLYLLLQVFDEGRLLGATGRATDFTRATLVMTSNLGARAAPRAGFGGSLETEHAHAMADVARAVRDFFPPELFHRIDRVVPFRPLDASMAQAIVRRELRKLLARRGLTERRIAVSTTESLVKLATERAFDGRRGARSVKGWLESEIGSLLARHIAGERRAEQRELTLHVKEGVIAVHAEALGEAETTPLALLALPDVEDLPALRALAEQFGEPRLHEDVAESLRAARRHLAKDEHATSYALERAIVALESLRKQHERLLTPEAEAAREAFEDDMERDIRVERGRTYNRHDTRRRLALARGAAAHDEGGARSLRDHLGELLALARALPPSEEPGAHVVDVLVTSLGERAGAASFVATLADAVGRWSGEIQEVLGRTSDGALVDWMTAERSAARRESVVAAVVRVVGLGARARLSSERGTQVIVADDAPPELISVRDLPHRPERRLADTFAELEAQRVAFMEALEAGASLPPHPAPLLPRIRTVRIEHRLNGAIDVTIEDHRIGDVIAGRVSAVEQVLAPVHARLSLALPETAEQRVPR